MFTTTTIALYLPILHPKKVPNIIMQ